MFRYVCAAAMLAATAMPLAAQGPASNFKIGVIGGVNLANVDVTDLSTKSKVGGDIGVTVNWKISDMFSLQPEVHYSMKGFKADLDVGGTTAEATLDLHALDVPVLGRFDFGTAGSTRPFLLVGPYLAAKVKCDIKASAGGVSATQSCDDAGFGVASTDVGGIAGAGFEFAMLGRPWTIGARYQFGFTDLDTADGSEAKNRTFQVLLGVTF